MEFKKMKVYITSGLVLVVIAGWPHIQGLIDTDQDQITGAPPYGVSDQVDVPQYQNAEDWRRVWKRPAGAAKVGVQVGHWKHKEAPEELKNLRKNPGAAAGNISEVEINYKIANLIKSELEENGVLVDLLPTTIPPGYWADVFITVHADGSEEVSKSGYKFAGPWRDFTGNADLLVAMLNEEYGRATGLPYDSNITRNMRGYYAFSWWRYDHAIHPMTTAVIAETGFVTNTRDRELIHDSAEIPAEAIARTLIKYLSLKELI